MINVTSSAIMYKASWTEWLCSVTSLGKTNQGKSFGPALLSLECAMCELPREDLFKMQIQISRSGWGLGFCILTSSQAVLSLLVGPRTTLRGVGILKGL